MVYLDYAAGSPKVYYPCEYESFGDCINLNTGYAKHNAKEDMKRNLDKIKMYLGVKGGRVEVGPNASVICRILAEHVKNYGAFFFGTKVEHSCVYDIVDSRFDNDDQMIESILSKNDYSEEYPLVAFKMAVNNVTGEIFDNRKLKDVCNTTKAFLVSDFTAVLPNINVKDIGVDRYDVIFASTSKIGTEQGLGFIWMSDRFCECFGIDDEYPLIPGTPNQIRIKQVTNAVEDEVGNDGIYDRELHWECSVKLWEKLSEAELIDPNVEVPDYYNGDKHVKGINLIVLKDIMADPLQQYLASKQIYIGVGHSSCEANGDYRVLEASGFTKSEAERAIRVSFGFDTRPHDINVLVDAIKEFKGRFC